MRRARGEGSIFALPDGRYAAEVSLGFDARGVRRRQRVTAKTRSAVREKLLDIQARIRKGEHVASPRKTIANWLLTDWLPMVHARRRGSTAGDYERTVQKYLVPWLRSRRFGELKAAHLESWYLALREEGVGPRAISKVHATLRTALSYAVKMEVAGKNVATQVEPPAYRPGPRRRYSIEQTLVFLRALHGHPAEALFVTALFSQLRSGELFALTWSDVDLDRRTLSVARTMTDDAKGRPVVGETTKTRAGQRTIIVPKIVVRALREHRKRLLAKGLASPYVFPATMGPGGRGKGGGPLRRQNVGRYWLHPLQRSAEIPEISFHELRHTGASILKELGGDLLALRDRLGHESESTTADIYVHLDLAEQRKLSNLLDARFSTG